MNLKGKLSFTLVPDEETGGALGTQHLIASRFIPRANLGMLMPEPTSGVIWNANKGALTLKKAIRDIRGESPAFEICPGLCGIRYFNTLGYPSYAYGPGLLDVSHGPQEYVRIPDLLDCTAVAGTAGGGDTPLII